MKKRMLFLTGSPGVGKTTLLVKIIESLEINGFRVGGMVTREVRKDGLRVGFEIMNLLDNSHGWLARVDQDSGPQVGKYRVNLKDLARTGAGSIMLALETSDVIAIDEIGPMELFSDEFKRAVKSAVEGDKLVVGIIHRNTRDPLIEWVKRREDAHIVTVTNGNRNELHEIVVGEAIEFLQQGKN